MSKYGLAVPVAAFSLAFSAASFGMGFGIKAGLHSPMGDYGDVMDEGLTIAGQFISSKDDQMVLGAHIGYSLTASTGKGTFQGVDVKLDIDYSMIEIYPFVDMYLSRTHSFDPFLRAGGGLNRGTLKREACALGSCESDSESNSDAMVVVGGGVTIIKNLELVGVYHRVFDDLDTTYLNITIGYNF
jgi:hypothetical protein